MEKEILTRMDRTLGDLIENARICRETGFSDWSPDQDFALTDLIESLKEDGRFKHTIRFFEDIDNLQLSVI